LVKRYLNELDANAPEALDNPHQVLDEAFQQFSISGPQADSIMGNFNIYFDLHCNYLVDIDYLHHGV
jgi:hypothetical protein